MLFYIRSRQHYSVTVCTKPIAGWLNCQGNPNREVSIGRSSWQASSWVLQLVLALRPGRDQEASLNTVQWFESYVLHRRVSKRRRTLEAAVHVSNNTCFEILSFFDASAHQVGNLSEHRSYPLCFTAWSYVTGSVG
ncbi:hypothetical protein PoB_002712300 [Plakobranchus ocellatus]|uniref:Uncharacterized protein n=1 Tax=Plakobranchus ocellatus TaxID=259542 RepID=A0AAV4A1N8_9GAST|nr:hypothetical protein PoB_002712300 [Plakobranchus ocellatus]